ncbi:Oxysterol-binding protein-related protein 3 [Grifola frondosa]|uniref:Oxysterol-binding protein-related protein 3 n=1 Tax=Grifola frondosa TaxID=5627 RepID=A0A1C7MQP0_GRIFR|nr:Oxysterol-binding protein-related protein 3 [Grifola frondosa]
MLLDTIAFNQAGGWVLKKRRKRMQGFARRFFTLHQSGLLSYSYEPGQPIRDQVLLTQAAISTAPGRKDIHIDSNTTTFHIKCLGVEDFNMWMAAFRKFLAQEGMKSRRSSLARSTSRVGHYNRTGALVEEIGVTINELHEVFSALSEEETRRKTLNSRSKTEKDKKEHYKEHSGSVLSLFKKGHHHEHTHDSVVDGRTSQADAGSYSILFQRMETAVESLKFQHMALAKSFHAYPSIDTNIPSTHSQTLPATAEEDDDGCPTPTTTNSTGRISKRMSAFSSTSGDGSVWFDAPEFDGPEEFVLDESPGDEVQESKLYHVDSQSSERNDAASSTETDTESDIEEEVEVEEVLVEAQVARRTRLPSGPVGDEGSLFAVLKKNVGKDLSRVALPVTFNEPLTLLQKTAEDLEYFDILSQAARTEDPVERMCYVASFAVSTYANTKHRSSRKGFNPMLAETFEDSRMKFISEKVCHNPVILAYHAEGEGWELYATSSGKTKFWGKSMEIIPQGTIHLKFGEEHYQWNRPSSFMRNLMMGTKYLEHCGKMVIDNVSSGARCALEFKEGGYWGPTNLVSGTVHSPSGSAVAHLEGKWDEQMSRKLDSSHLHVLWRITPFPNNALEFYGFSAFGITLNEITPDLEGKLPPTDSRLRTDVRALENGDIDFAEREKLRIEEMQRERRNCGAERSPRWFKQVGEEWLYIGGYWEQRAQGWSSVEPLW